MLFKKVSKEVKCEPQSTCKAVSNILSTSDQNHYIHTKYFNNRAQNGDSLEVSKGHVSVFHLVDPKTSCSRDLTYTGYKSSISLLSIKMLATL